MGEKGRKGSSSKAMIFNFTHNHQFTTQKKLLGTIITEDLKGHRNTQYCVKKAYARMKILYKIAYFGAPQKVMRHLTFKPFHRKLRNPGECTKMCCEIILNNEYTTYEKL